LLGIALLNPAYGLLLNLAYGLSINLA